MYASTLPTIYKCKTHANASTLFKNKSKYRVRERDNEHRIFNVENLRRDQKPWATGLSPIEKLHYEE